MPQVRCPECFHAVSQSRDNSNFLFCFLFHSWAGVLNDAKKHAGLFLLSPSLKLWVRLFFNSFPVNYEDTDFPNSVLSAFSFNIIHENPAVSFTTTVIQDFLGCWLQWSTSESCRLFDDQKSKEQPFCLTRIKYGWVCLWMKSTMDFDSSFSLNCLQRGRT